MIEKLEFGNEIYLIVDKRAFLTHIQDNYIDFPAIKISGNFRTFVGPSILIDLHESSKALIDKLTEDWAKAHYEDEESNTKSGYTTGTIFPIDIQFVRTIELNETLQEK